MIRKLTIYLHQEKEENSQILVDEGLMKAWCGEEKFCSNSDCRCELAENDIFCKFCGEKYDEAKVATNYMSEKATQHFRYAAYEVELTIELNTESGSAVVTHFNGVELKPPPFIT